MVEGPDLTFCHEFCLAVKVAGKRTGRRRYFHAGLRLVVRSSTTGCQSRQSLGSPFNQVKRVTLMDVHTRDIRSYNMSRIRSRDTSPEIVLRTALWGFGFRYRLHRKDLPGTPDLVFPAIRRAIFVHGCFWHKHNCRFFVWPQSNRKFWREKIEGNCERDRRSQRKLLEAGWKILVVWECQLKKPNLIRTFRRVVGFLDS